MKKKDEIILEIQDVNFPNKAYGYCEGEKVIVKNAGHGASYYENQKQYEEAVTAFVEKWIPKK